MLTVWPGSKMRLIRLQILLQQGDLDFASYMKWRARVNETMMGLHDGINADVLRIL